MSCTSPAPLSVQPEALLTRREGSSSFTHFVTRVVPSLPYGPSCPQPSLNGTHITIEGEFRCCSTSTFISLSNCFCQSPPALAIGFGMSCQTRKPILSAQ